MEAREHATNRKIQLRLRRRCKRLRLRVGAANPWPQTTIDRNETMSAENSEVPAAVAVAEAPATPEQQKGGKKAEKKAAKAAAAAEEVKEEVKVRARTACRWQRAPESRFSKRLQTEPAAHVSNSSVD